MKLNIKKIRPLNTQIITTANRYTQDSSTGGVILSSRQVEGSVKEYQTVVAVGTMVRNIKVGDTVFINPSRYIKKKYGDNTIRDDMDVNPTVSIDIPVITLDNVDHFFIDEQDVAYIIEDYEEVPDTPASTIILPKKPTIIGIDNTVIK